MPIAPFPHSYSVTLAADELTAGPREPIVTGAPPQFGGTEAVWSPEHLLIAAALTCLKTTFDAYARREKIAIHHWRGTGTGVLAKGRTGPTFTAIELAVDILTDPGDEARAEAVLAVAERNCIISQTLTAPVHVTGTVKAAAERAAG
jgi:organic hydroperoxide reductase OsmC/OhrA